jgi:hypothetical protein
MSAMTKLVQLLEIGLLAFNLVVAGHALDGNDAAEGRDRLTGRIMLVTEKDIVLQVSSDQHRIAVSSATEVMLDGNAAELMALPLGSEALVTCEGKNPARAVSIHATSMKWSKANRWRR